MKKVFILKRNLEEGLAPVHVLRQSSRSLDVKAFPESSSNWATTIVKRTSGIVALSLTQSSCSKVATPIYYIRSFILVLMLHHERLVRIREEK